MKSFLFSANHHQEVVVFDHYAPRIGPLQMVASVLLIALAVWAITLLTR